LAQDEWKGKIEVLPVSDIFEVLQYALKDGEKKKKLLAEMRKELAN